MSMRWRIDKSSKDLIFRWFDCKCAMCRLDAPGILQIHHIDEDAFNPQLSNLILLCPNCHASAHLKPKRRFVFDGASNVDLLGEWADKYDSKKLKGCTARIVPKDCNEPAGS